MKLYVQSYEVSKWLSLQMVTDIFIETVVQDSELDHLACYLNEENKNFALFN